VVETRSLSVQSVLFNNAPQDISRAGLALANSVSWARQAGLVGDWTLHLGDCSDVPVFDDGHLAELLSAVTQVGGRLDHTVFGRNLGSAAGHNALATRSTSDLLLILNPDAKLAPDAVTALARRVDGTVGMAEARQVPLEHPKDFRQSDGVTSWASTAAALTTRAAFDKVGGFDSATFFLYCDDVDYSWRLRLAGLDIVYEPAAAVFHDKRLTVTGDWPAGSAEVYYSAEAALLLAYKYSRPDLVRDISLRFKKNGEPLARKALAEFERRRAAGELPDQIDHMHKVGQFVGGNYAKHRF